MSGLFPHGVRDLKISAPTNLGQMASALRCKVILIAKFSFDAESSDELSVKKGDVLKLLDRLASGWVLVEFIDKIASPGLVPALYVDIAVNDPSNPITLLWLHEMSHDANASNTFNDVQVQMLLENNTPFSINNKLYPLSASVSNYLMYENRYWYRVDVTYSLGEQGYLCRYYLDFYDLHLSLREYVNMMGDETLRKILKLPKLPEPVPSQKRDSTEQKELFTHRCRELSAYMHELISTKTFQICTALVDWLDVGFKAMPGFIVDETPQESSDDLNQRILPGSVILASKIPPSAVSDTSKDEQPDKVKFIAPSKDAHRPNKPKNVYNHYQQAANAKINIARSLSTSEGRYPTRSNSKLERARTVSSTNHAPKKIELDQASSPKLPLSRKSGSIKGTSSNKAGSAYTTPIKRIPTELLDLQSPLQKLESPATSPGSVYSDGDSESQIRQKMSSSHQSTSIPMSAPTFIPHKGPFGTPKSCKSLISEQGKLTRCEIKTQTSDHVVVRIIIAENMTVEDFKAAIYLKIVYNNLFIRLEESGAYEEIDSPGLNVIKTILQSDTVYLLIT